VIGDLLAIFSTNQLTQSRLGFDIASRITSPFRDFRLDAGRELSLHVCNRLEVEHRHSLLYVGQRSARFIKG
jgi:hypothetical protein